MPNKWRFIEVRPGFPADHLQRAVETNGPSMLFGAAREILRSATGRGPYGPLLIVEAMKPFIESLIDSSISTRVMKKHLDNLWLLGGVETCPTRTTQT